jgi:hypothetical protein
LAVSHLYVVSQVHKPLIAGCLSLFETIEQSRSQVLVVDFQLNELWQVQIPLDDVVGTELATLEQLRAQEAVVTFQN